jgi:outer membrane murein-binding lipoprotein Lpp
MLMATLPPRSLMAAGAGMLTVLLAQAPAQAQSVEELQSQIESLNQQLQQLQQQQQQLMNQMEAATEEPIVPETVVRTEQDGVRLTLAGRVNQSVLYASQDDQDQVFIADNDGSGSRVEFLAESDFGEWTSGLEVVVSAEVNSTDEIDFGSTDDNADENPDLGDFRQAHWFVEHPRYGYFSIGQGDTAAEDTTFVDLSGTDFAGAGADVDDIAGGLTFIDENGNRLTEVDDFFDAQDDGRSLRAIYQTPSFMGAALAVSVNNDAQSLEDGDDPAGDGVEPAVGIEYGAEIGGYEVEAAASWRREDEVDARRDIFTGSASVLAPFGVSFTLAGSVGDNSDEPGDVDDPTMVFGKIGYRQTFFDFGETRFSLDGYRGTNEVDFASPDGDLPEALGGGIFAVQAVEELNAEFYIGGRVYALDDVYNGGQEVDVDSLYAVISGARVRF